MVQNKYHGHHFFTLANNNESRELKLPYKFQYRDSNKKLPCNKEILVFACSDVKCPIANTVPDLNSAPLCVPKLQIQAKLAFTDE